MSYCAFWWRGASLMAQKVKNLPARQKTWVWSLGWEEPLEKGIAAHSSILAFCFFLYCTNSLKSIHMTHLNSDYPFFKCSMPTKATILPSGHNSGQCRSTWWLKERQNCSRNLRAIVYKQLWHLQRNWTSSCGITEAV